MVRDLGAEVIEVKIMDKCPGCGESETLKVEKTGGLIPARPNIYVKHEEGGSARMAICEKCGAAYPSDEKLKEKL